MKHPQIPKRKQFIVLSILQNDVKYNNNGGKITSKAINQELTPKLAKDEPGPRHGSLCACRFL
jgi:hypothetical protein